MQKYLGDILLEKGYINSTDLDRALAYQTRQISGSSPSSGWVAAFLLDVARKKYNQREEYYLGKILTELNLLPQAKVAEALEIQRSSPLGKPRDRLEALNQVIHRVNSSYNLIDLLNQILVLAVELAEAESASLIIYDHARDALVILMPSGPKAEQLRDLEIPKDQGIVGWVYRTAASVICNDTAADSRFYAGIDARVGYNTRQVLCVPLTVKGKRLGALEVINKRQSHPEEGAGFSEADLSLLEMFSAQAAIGIENTRLSVTLSRLEAHCALQAEQAAAQERIRAGLAVSRSLLQEIRKSLVPLQGYTRRLGDVLPDARIQKYGDFIDREVERLIETADETVRFFRGDCSPRPQVFSVAEMLEDLEARTWVACRLSHTAFRASAPRDLMLKADRQMLLRVLAILFRNSMEAMPQGGEFSVAVRAQEGFVIIEASDTGPGIPEGSEERIFEPLYTSGKPRAAGLGLPIARRMVEAHGGTICARTRPEGGALLSITLPSA